MNRKIKQLLSGVMLTCIITIAVQFSTITAYAAGARISFSDPSVIVGKEVNVTMKITSDGEALGGADVMLSYDTSMLEFISGTNANGGAGSIRLIGSMDSTNTTSFSFTLKFKALQAGSTKINVSTQEIYDINTQAVTLEKQGNSTVTVKPLATYSTDSKLSSLKVSPGTLTPEFSAGVTDYSANVDADVTKIAVSAVTSNANAKMTLSGNTDLKPGENSVVCKVTAEDGKSVTQYTIKVTRADTGESQTDEPEHNGDVGAVGLSEQTAIVNETTYYVAESFDEGGLPEGFEADSYTYKGTEVMAGRALEKELLILYLQDEGGNGGFYIYDENSDSFTEFVEVQAAARTIIIVPLDEDVKVPAGFVENSISIDGYKVSGWTWEGDAEQRYCIFYGMNWKGEKNFYRYDLETSEKTLQRYFEDPAISAVSTGDYVEVAEKYNALCRDYKIQFAALIALIIISVVLFVLVIILYKKHKNTEINYSDDEEIENEPEYIEEDEDDFEEIHLDENLHEDTKDDVKSDSDDDDDDFNFINI